MLLLLLTNWLLFFCSIYRHLKLEVDMFFDLHYRFETKKRFHLAMIPMNMLLNLIHPLHLELMSKEKVYHQSKSFDLNLYLQQ